MATEVPLTPYLFECGIDNLRNALKSTAESKTITFGDSYYSKTTMHLDRCSLFSVLTRTGQAVCFNSFSEADEVAHVTSRYFHKRASHYMTARTLTSVVENDRLEVIATRDMLDALDQDRTYEWTTAQQTYSRKVKPNKPGKIPLKNADGDDNMVYIYLEEALQRLVDGQVWTVRVYGNTTAELDAKALKLIARYHGVDVDKKVAAEEEEEDEEAVSAPKTRKRKGATSGKKKQKKAAAPVRTIPSDEARETIVTEALGLTFFERQFPKEDAYYMKPIALGGKAT